MTDSKREIKPKLAFGVEPSPRLYRLRLARYKALAEAIAGYAQKRPGPLTLLDIGVGRGRTLRYLEGEGEGIAERLTFWGVDISEKRLQNLYSPDKWRLVLADATRGLPLRRQSFDIAVVEQVLEHIPEPGALLRDIAGVLRPGSLLVVGVPVFPPVVETLRRGAAALLRTLFGMERGHLESFTLGSLRTMVEAGGLFKVTGSRGFRVLSGGVFSPLEDFKWWWRLNLFFGRVLPWLTTEVQLLAVRTESPASVPAIVPPIVPVGGPPVVPDGDKDRSG